MRFYIMQFKLGRRFLGGKFYYINPNLPMGDFWSDAKITSCGSKVLKTEQYK